MDYKQYIQTRHNWPQKGIDFRDIQPLLQNNEVFKNAITDLGNLVNEIPDYWVGIESRGFIFATALSLQFGGGIKLIRKKGKLPNKRTFHTPYNLEYGKDELEIGNDIREVGKKVVIVDDVFATGGTMEAAERLCNACGFEIIDRVCLIDIVTRETKVKTLIKY